MKRLVLVLFSIAGALASPAQELKVFDWPQEPIAFRGVSFGASIQEVAEVLKLKVIKKRSRFSAPHSGPPIKNCYEYASTCISYGKIGEIEPMFTWDFTDNRMESVAFSFPSGEFDFVRSVFVEKYGEAHLAEATKLTTRGGADLENEALIWSGPRTVITLSRYGWSAAYGVATVRTRAGYLRETAENDVAKKKAAEGL